MHQETKRGATGRGRGRGRGAGRGKRGRRAGKWDLNICGDGHPRELQCFRIVVVVIQGIDFSKCDLPTFYWFY